LTVSLLAVDASPVAFALFVHTEVPSSKTALAVGGFVVLSISAGYFFSAPLLYFTTNDWLAASYVTETTSPSYVSGVSLGSQDETTIINVAIRGKMRNNRFIIVAFMQLIKMLDSENRKEFNCVYKISEI